MIARIIKLFTGNRKDNINVIPVRGASWHEIANYAKKVNGYNESGSFKANADLANRSDLTKLTFKHFHMVLFFEFRRYNHFGYDPDSVDMEHMYKILDLMHIQSAQQGDALEPPSAAR